MIVVTYPNHHRWKPFVTFLLVSLLLSTAPLASQDQAAPQASAGAPNLVDLARSAKTIYITGAEGWVGIPTEPLEKKLFEYTEFQKGEPLIQRKAEGAGILIELARKPGTWDFTYSMIHRRTGSVFGSGKVIAWDGVRAGPGLAKQIIKRLRELRGAPAAEQKKKR